MKFSSLLKMLLGTVFLVLVVAELTVLMLPKPASRVAPNGGSGYGWPLTDATVADIERVWGKRIPLPKVLPKSFTYTRVMIQGPSNNFTAAMIFFSDEPIQTNDYYKLHFGVPLELRFDKMNEMPSDDVIDHLINQSRGEEVTVNGTRGVLLTAESIAIDKTIQNRIPGPWVELHWWDDCIHYSILAKDMSKEEVLAIAESMRDYLGLSDEKGV